ncbi:MAG: hypothetical protein KDD55_11820, partial [Bdellovibrionales bacterium]|nr:hypothetical protein [Bdellovibrionales bacterium]
LIDGVTGTLTADAASLVGVSATGTTSITVSRSTFKITGDSNCTGLSFNTSGSTEVRESYISATDTASGGGDAVNALYIDSTTKTQVINSEFVADSTGAGTVAAIYLGSNQTIELFNAKLVCSGDDTTLGCLYADAGGTVLVSSSKIKGEALRSCAYADNASIIRAVNSLYACADSGTANGGTVSCRSVYASDLTTLIGDACG